MNDVSEFEVSDQWILARRPPKHPVNPWRPNDFLVEKERTSEGLVEDVVTIFLANRECPFRCLMCDLWKKTADQRVPDGAIPAQIQWALNRLTKASHVKLYNSGNFFDEQAIPLVDMPSIASLLGPFRTALVESHPRLVYRRACALKELLRPELQVAMGLETVHPQVLNRLNKRMTLADFEAATEFLTSHGILVRAFILLRPPFLNESEGIFWAKRSLDFAFDVGTECCTIIPTRRGNGALEWLQERGLFSPPLMTSLEEVVEYGVQLKRGRVLADLWDIDKFLHCKKCSQTRVQRLHHINLYQHIQPRVECESCTKHD